VAEINLARDGAAEEEVLILAPTGRDAPLTLKVLADAEIASRLCGSMEELCLRFDRGVGAVLITEEGLTSSGISCLIEALDIQPPWSDIPIILFAANSESAGLLLSTLGHRANVMILERPISLTVLIGAVQSSLRTRRRQYDMRDLLDVIKEADRQKNLFLATLSHELRTPLNAMMGWAEILTTHDLNEGEAVHAIEVIMRNMKSLTVLINDMLDVSRIISGKLQLDLTAIDLTVVVDRAVRGAQKLAESKGLRLRSTSDCDSCRVLGDADRMQQVMANLLTNAIKFTPAGGEIDVRLERLDDHARITVVDTGQGISPDFLPYVFDRFIQADGSYTRKQGGLGLGLAIVRHLLELHHGTVQATSDGDGAGATFIVTLPLLADEPAVSDYRNAPPNPSPTPPADLRLDGLRVLVVDDETDAREMMTAMLTEYGARVTMAASVDEALSSVTNHPTEELPDVVVSDIGMPGKDGYDLIRRLRALDPEHGGKIPAIALTGYANVEERARALSEGFQMHIPKPVRLAHLAALLADLAGHG
jgi:signal transduction histidine kinase/ActR/RegA family two-component response regulator